MFYNVEQMPEQEKKFPIVGFRVSFDEQARLKELVARLQKKYKHLNISKIVREIIGFDPMTFVTREDIDFLKGEDKNKTANEAGDYRDDNYQLFDESQRGPVMSGGSDKPLSRKKRSQAVERDIEDVTNDAVERTRRKKSSPQKK